MTQNQPILTEFDTAGHQPTDAFDLWVSRSPIGIRPLFDVSGDISRFHVRQTGRIYGRVMVMDVEMSGLNYHRSAERARRDGVDFIWLEYTRRNGDGWIETPEGEAQTIEDSIYVADQGRAIDRRVPDANFMGVKLDRGLFTQQEIEDLTSTLINGARARLIGDFLKAVLAAPPTVSAEATEASLVSVIAAGVAASADRAQEVSSALGPVALDRARRYIDAHLDREGVTMDEVVAVTGVSRATLYRLFAPYGGLARFMWSRRLDAVRRAICNPSERRSLTVLAEAHGFTDSAHFSRAFKSEFGVRPSDLRPFLAA